MIREQVQAMRAQGQAIMATADAVLALLGKVEAAGDGACQHPGQLRESCPTMGYEHRWRCRGCEQVFDGEGGP